MQSTTFAPKWAICFSFSFITHKYTKNGGTSNIPNPNKPKKNERTDVQKLLPGTNTRIKKNIASAMYKIDFIRVLNPPRFGSASFLAREADRFAGCFFFFVCFFVCFFADN